MSTPTHKKAPRFPEGRLLKMSCNQFYRHFFGTLSALADWLVGSPALWLLAAA
jgi:hypothetical protein